MASVAGEGSAATNGASVGLPRGKGAPVAPVGARGVGAISSVLGEGGAANPCRLRGENMPVGARGVGAISSVLGEGGAASAGPARGESTLGVSSRGGALGLGVMEAVVAEAPSGEAR